MQRLAKILHEHNCSLVVESQDGVVSTYNGRGINDLYRLYTESPMSLMGACTADKVVGAGAAVLMALGGVREFYADVISRRALAILDVAGINGSYAIITEHIINRAGTGRCPLESRLDGVDDMAVMYDIISRFVADLPENNTVNALK